MKIRIELVGFLARIGLPNGFVGGELDVPDDTTLDTVLDQLGIAHNTPWLVSVNRRLADRDRVLIEGDVVKIIPPISGG